jgi:2-hydroxychromene-2-carboxylate isomerase
VVSNAPGDGAADNKETGMAASLDFYFDFSSPYGYFGAMRIEELAERHGRMVHWHPVLLGVVFKTTGGAPLPQIPMKGEYSLRDFARSARYLGIPYRQPTAFPISTQAAARAMLWARREAGESRAVELALAIYRAYFVEDINISEPAEIARIGAALGFDPAALEAALGTPEIKDALRLEVEQAMARGVFGSPFVIADGEPFWGVDRFEQLEAFLKNGKI